MRQAWERAKASPLSLTIGVILSGGALSRLLSGGPVDGVGPWIGVALLLALLASGFVIVAGVLWRGTETMARAVERSGYYLGASSYVAALIAVVPEVTPLWTLLPSVIQAVGIVGGTVGRVRALHRADRTQETVRDALLRDAE